MQARGLLELMSSSRSGISIYPSSLSLSFSILEVLLNRAGIFGSDSSDSSKEASLLNKDIASSFLLEKSSSQRTVSSSWIFLVWFLFGADCLTI